MCIFCPAAYCKDKEFSEAVGRQSGGAAGVEAPASQHPGVVHMYSPAPVVLCILQPTPQARVLRCSTASAASPTAPPAPPPLVALLCRRRLTPQPIKIRADIEMTCFRCVRPPPAGLCLVAAAS